MKIRNREYFAPWEKAYERLTTPFDEFMHLQTTGGLLLIFCTLFALLIANSPLLPFYDALLHIPVSISVGNLKVEHDLHHWINDGLMTIFFFVVGLDIKREIIGGHLSRIHRAVIPMGAAIGGMLVPALIYLSFNPDGLASRGWAIPMATDIAFSIGILALLGRLVPNGLVAFLVALAIVDDLGAVTVIALFYTEQIQLNYLVIAGAIWLVMFCLNLFGIRNVFIYFMLAIGLWFSFEGSGVHATLAGVLSAWTVPAYARYDPQLFSDKLKSTLQLFEHHHDEREMSILSNPKQAMYAREMEKIRQLSISPLQRLQRTLHMPTTYFVVPIFALANAAVPVSWEISINALSTPIYWGIFIALFVGKPLGISLFVYLMVRFKIGQLPKGVSLQQIFGASMLAGIGFTMSIFIAELAFVWDGYNVVVAKFGILSASILSGIMGYLYLLKHSQDNQAVTENY